MFISVGHDEYWSSEMRDRVEAFVKAGGNAAFFSANTSWWRIKVDDLNIMTCKKSAIEDPDLDLMERQHQIGLAAPTDRPRKYANWRKLPTRQYEFVQNRF